MDTVLIVLGGVLIGGAWSLRRQRASRWLVGLTVAAGALSLVAAVLVR